MSDGLASQLHRPFEVGANKANVAIFILQDCPVSNGYAPEINRIVTEFGPEGIGFYLVHVDSNLRQDEARKHAEGFGFKCPVLVDRDHKLVRRAKATVAPEAFVIGRDGVILYRGRIDDRYVAIGKRKPAPTTRDLRDALQAVLEDRPVRNPVTKPLGCFIPTE